MAKSKNKEVEKIQIKQDWKSSFKPIKKARWDLVIFGVLIYILGIFTGLFLGIGISEGDLSMSTFQRFFSSEDQIEIEEMGGETGDHSSEGIIIDNSASVTSSGGLVSGGGDGGGAGATGGSTVTQVADTSKDSGGERQGPAIEPDTENYIEETTTSYAD